MTNRVTGRICWRYALSVTDVPLWPTSREMCSIGRPESDSSGTKLCRISRDRLDPATAGPLSIDPLLLVLLP